MTWSDTWDDILSGGNSRWKVTDIDAKRKALDHILSNTASSEKLNILCPLAGDDEFVHYAWTCGHNVTAIDIVPAALEAMRGQFPGEWSSTDIAPHTLWQHSSGRVQLYQGDVFATIPDLKSKFDAAYDKDSFGALEKDLRQPLVTRFEDYLKPDGIIYMEVKNKPEGRRAEGPPYHLEREDLEKAFTGFRYLQDLGELYPLSLPMKQMGHILKRMRIP